MDQARRVDPAEPITPPRGDAAAGVSRSKRLGLLRMSLTRHLIDTHTRAQKKAGHPDRCPAFFTARRLPSGRHILDHHLPEP